MRITTKGQVTIPAHIREKAGLLPHTEVRFVLEEGSVRLVPMAPVKGPSRGEEVLLRLSGRAGGGLSTEEIMALTREP